MHHTSVYCNINRHSTSIHHLYVTEICLDVFETYRNSVNFLNINLMNSYEVHILKETSIIWAPLSLPCTHFNRLLFSVSPEQQCDGMTTKWNILDITFV